MDISKEMTMPQSLPDNIRFLERDELDKAALRVAIMSEFDCINTYEQILTLVKEGELRTFLLRILDEDKTHAQSLQETLARLDASKKVKPPESIEIPIMEEYTEEY